MPRCKDLKRELERREKIRQKALGRLKSPETCEKIRLSKLGKKRSPETIAKMSLSKTIYTPEQKREVKKQWQNKHYAKLRLEVLTYYSNSLLCCAHCGLDDLDVLCIDHIDGGGNQHTQKLRKEGKLFYRWLKNEGFPDGYQVLCANCNMKKEKERLRDGRKLS